MFDYLVVVASKEFFIVHGKVYSTIPMLVINHIHGSRMLLLQRKGNWLISQLIKTTFVFIL